MAQPAYGFTGEMADVTGLTYLRARYYSPLEGRFMSRDTWEGDARRPLSMNRWMYVEGNPVNLIDPSGKFPIECQSMPTKEEYASCVLSYYDLEPYDEHNLSLSVEGGQGCYSGPEKYRAPGYIEGVGWQVGPYFGNGEFVYDFATMQGADFYGLGGGMSATYPFFADSVYIGNIMGLKHSDEDAIDIFDNYEGPVGFFAVGINDMLPVAINAGVVEFTSTQDPKIRGVDYYFGASVGIPIYESLPIDITFGGVINTKRLSGVITNYIMTDGRVNAGQLYNDIQSGTNSPLMGLAKYSYLRQMAVLTAMKYVLAYESLHEEQWLGK